MTSETEFSDAASTSIYWDDEGEVEDFLDSISTTSSFESIDQVGMFLQNSFRLSIQVFYDLPIILGIPLWSWSLLFIRWTWSTQSMSDNWWGMIQKTLFSNISRKYVGKSEIIRLRVSFSYFLNQIAYFFELFPKTYFKFEILQKSER